MPELNAELLRQLVGSRIEVLLGSPLRQPPATEPGELATFTVTTEAGVEVTADIWFRCYGVVPNSDYLGKALAPARQADGFIDVTPTLQVTGHSTVFALGDLSTADAKMAGFAGRQAALVADNINALAQGRSDLAEYQSMGVAIAVPIGPTGGAGQFPGQDEIVGPETIAELKGRDLMVERYGEFFGLATAAAR
jgi:NADH dehydrogenase FAD-containing subunit